MTCPHCLTCDCATSPAFVKEKAERIASLEASIAALGNEGRAGRERLNVSELLLNLGVPFVDDAITSVATGQDPPDVQFDGARFEIKELYDDGRRRTDEYQQRLAEAKVASHCAELQPTSLYTPKSTTLAQVLQLSIETAEGHSKRYDQRLVPTLDLLLYHNLVDVYEMNDEPWPDTAEICSQGWRSVSVLFGHRAIVFCAEAGAPAWLQTAAGKVTHRE